MNEVTSRQKNAAAIMVMQRVLEKYSEEKSITFDEALIEFASTVIYRGLFDFETGLWREGPDYILDMVHREANDK